MTESRKTFRTDPVPRASKKRAKTIALAGPLRLDNEGDVWNGDRLVGCIEDRPTCPGYERELANLWESWNQSLDDLLRSFI